MPALPLTDLLLTRIHQTVNVGRDDVVLLEVDGTMHVVTFPQPRPDIIRWATPPRRPRLTDTATPTDAVPVAAGSYRHLADGYVYLRTF